MNQFRKKFGFRNRRPNTEPTVEEEDSDNLSPASEPLDPLSRSLSDTTDPQLRRHFSQASTTTAPPLSESSAFPRQQTRNRNNAAPQDLLGLNVLHRPNGKRKADIVFVHGLGGTSRFTWSKYKNLDFFWPDKFLPRDHEIGQARILTWGYDASFRPGSNKNPVSILDFAKYLLFDLKNTHDDLDPDPGHLAMGECPIIFVVHSMGGLVLKEAYMQGQHDPEYKSIIQAIKAIVFLATPHRGTNLAEILNRILQVSVIAGPKQFVSELTKNSTTLQRLNEQFRHIAPLLHIVSFYEMHATPVFNRSIMVLEKDSSILGYPGEVSRGLQADHHGVCKYESVDDPLYIIVRNVLRSLVGKVHLESTPTKSRRGSDVEAFLAVFGPPDSDYNFFRDRWIPGTCDWILDHENFINWIQDDGGRSRVLWMYGNAASGKSILASFIINHLVQQGLPCQYFFVRFGDEKKRTISTILRSIASQISRTNSAYADMLMALAAESANLKTADTRSTWEWLFCSNLFQLELEQPLYWVVDGLEESDNPRALIRLLSDLSKTLTPIRILLVTRETKELSSEFEKLGRDLRVESICSEDNGDDLRCYIEREMDLDGNDKSYKDQIMTRILEGAKGNFLWVHLAVQEINKCATRGGIEEALEQMPPGMGPLYDRMASKIDKRNPSDKQLANDILAWTTCSRRSLFIRELSEALLHNEPLDLHRSIVELCGGFVVSDIDGRVALIHQTAKDYWLGTPTHTGKISSKLANEQLFNRCMKCLNDPTLRSRLKRNQPPLLLKYAISSWFVHLCAGDITSSNLLQSTVSFLRGNSVLTWIHAAAQNNELRSVVIASRYLNTYLMRLKRSDAERGTQSTQVKVAEWELIINWSADLVKIVGKFGVNLSHPDAIYKLVPPFCPRESVVYEQFGRNLKTLSVSGFSNSAWSDCLARITLEKGAATSAIQTAGSRIAVLCISRRSSIVYIFNSTTFEETRRILTEDRARGMRLNTLGTLLVIYGYKTTSIWNLSAADDQTSIRNAASPVGCVPKTIRFVNNDTRVLAGCDDRRVRSLGVGNTSSGWEITAELEEEELEGTNANSPTCMALSPAGDQIALGYRRHPVTVWSIDSPDGPKSVGKVRRALDDTQWTAEVTQLAWHPFSGEVLGLSPDQYLFKWNPEDDETKELQMTATNLTVSGDGSLCATGDSGGTIKIIATSDFALLYQISFEDPVLDLSFSMDARRIYDVRDLSCNVWEPDTLVRLADSSEMNDRSNDAASETNSLAKGSLLPEHSLGEIDSITAISAQPTGRLYCYCTANGSAVLYDATRGKICVIGRSKSYMSIEQVCWSVDSKLLAYSDLSGQLSIKSVSESDQDPLAWTVKNVLTDHSIPVQRGIRQMFFHATREMLFVFTPSSLILINISSKTHREILIPTEIPQIKWVRHPASTDHLLGFAANAIYMSHWNGFHDIASLPFELPNMSNSIDEPANRVVGNPVLTPDSSYILVPVTQRVSFRQDETAHLLFSIGAIDHIDGFSKGIPEFEIISGNSSKDFSMLPPDISARIHRPLAFLSREKLIFLDKDHWICSTQLPFPAPSMRRRSSTQITKYGSKDVKGHYFLPGDWISNGGISLCSLMSDGTFLCPRNGDVAVVQASLRD